MQYDSDGGGAGQDRAPLWETLAEGDPSCLTDPAMRGFVLVYADWCGACKGIMPAICDLQDHVERKGMGDAMQCFNLGKRSPYPKTVRDDISQALGVEYFPTIAFLANGKKMAYAGGRTSEDLIEAFESEVGGNARQ